MCCCIPLRRLSYLGAILHMITGLFYLYFLGSVTYTLYTMKEQPQARPRLVMGLFYMAYYAAFLPPGIFIFWGVHKQLRHFLVVPSIAFMLIQAYGVGLESYFGYRPQWLPDAIKKYNQSGELNKLRVGFWMDVTVQVTVTVVYLFMLFFYFREIGPDTRPVQSRYAQAYHHHPQGGAGQLGSMGGGTLGGPGTGGAHHHHQHPHQHHHPQLIEGGGMHNMGGLGPQPPVPFRPVSLGGQGQSSVVPMSLSLGTSNQGGGGGGPGSISGGGGRNSTPCPPIPPPVPQFSLAALSNLTYEQQQQLLKLQQHPLLMQQHQEEQQQQLHHHLQHQQSVSDLAQHPLLQQQFQSYAQHMLANPKTPKF